MISFSQPSPQFTSLQDVIMYAHHKAVDEVRYFFEKKDIDIEDLMATLIRNYGLHHIDIIMRTIVSLMGRYRDSPVEGGELVSLEEGDFDIGLEIFERDTVNKSLVYPVLLYGLTYAKHLVLSLPEESPLLIDTPLFPKEVDFSNKITVLVGVGIQHRFWYLRHLDIQKMLWGEAKDQEDEKMDSEILLACVGKIPALWVIS